MFSPESAEEMSVRFFFGLSYNFELFYTFVHPSFRSGWHKF